MLKIKTYKLHKNASQWCTEDGKVLNIFPPNEHLKDGIYYATIKRYPGLDYDFVLRLVYSDENFE